MPKPYHIIATEDEHGYNITIPENPNVSAHCTEPADIMPTAAAAKEQDEQNRHEKTAVCPKCGKLYRGYPALSRVDNKTEICPECGTREALDAIGMEKAEQDKIIAEMQKAAQKEYPPGCAPIPTPENTVPFDVDTAFEQLKKPEVQAEIKAILNGDTE